MRILSAAALAGALALPTATFAQNSRTLLMGSGKRVSGELASYDQTTIDVRDTSGARFPQKLSDVVLIEFGGDASQVPEAELKAARDAGVAQLLVLRNGSRSAGRIVDFVNEGGPDAALIFDAQGQGRQNVRLGEVARLFVNPLTDQALAALGAAATTAVPSTTGDSDTRTLKVPGSTAWMDSGLFVRQGERFLFQADGTIRLRGGEAEAKPAGAVDGSRAPNAPLPTSLAGALIGRISNGQPFGIGDQPMIAMPAAGRLYIGINDDTLGDNSGEFTVKIVRVR